MYIKINMFFNQFIYSLVLCGGPIEGVEPLIEPPLASGVWGKCTNMLRNYAPYLRHLPISVINRHVINLSSIRDATSAIFTSYYMHMHALCLLNP